GSASAGIWFGIWSGATSSLAGGGSSSFWTFMSLGTMGAAAGGAITLGGLISTGFGGGGASGLATSSTNFTSTSFSTMIRRAAVPIVTAAPAISTYTTEEPKNAASQCVGSWS